MPTQQLILSTYIFLFLVAMVSIAEFQIIMRHRKKQEAKVGSGGRSCLLVWA